MLTINLIMFLKYSIVFGTFHWPRITEAGCILDSTGVDLMLQGHLTEGEVTRFIEVIYHC
jgi:hypothetical protein